jgi:hypothetical protein
MTVAKMACSALPGCGFLLNGRVHNAGYRPLASSLLSTYSRGNLRQSIDLLVHERQLQIATVSNAITTDCSIRRSPQFGITYLR